MEWLLIIALFGLLLSPVITAAILGMRARSVPWPQLERPASEVEPKRFWGEISAKRRVKPMPANLTVVEQKCMTDAGILARSRWITDGTITDEERDGYFTSITIANGTYAYRQLDVLDNGRPTMRSMVWEAYATPERTNWLIKELGQFHCMSRSTIYYFCANIYLFSGCNYQPDDPFWLSTHPRFTGLAPIMSGLPSSYSPEAY